MEIKYVDLKETAFNFVDCDELVQRQRPLGSSPEH
jgi:hypothetical protein